MHVWLAVAVATAAALWWYLPLVVRSGAGYKAKVLSTVLFTQQRAVDIEGADEVAADSYRLLRLFRAQVDRQRFTVTTSFFGLAPQTAVWRDGLGSTLMFDQPLPAPPPRPAPQRHVAWQRQDGPRGLGEVIDRYFADPDRRRRRRTHAILVARGGVLVAERYADGFGPASLMPGWSVAKSLAAALVGILVGDGALHLDDRELWPTWRGRDSRAAITLEDLLRMRSGLRFTERYASPHSDVLRMLYREPDMAAFAASRPLTAEPGTLWSYSSGTSNIISAILKRIVGDGYLTWPRKVLFDRIDMPSALLETDAAGTFVLSSYMLATARDWLRYGEFHLHDGVWNGTRILPVGWMDFCRTPTPQSPTANYGAHWLLELNADIGGQSPAAARIPSDAYFAVGHEAQTLTIIPSLDLVILRHGLSIYIDGWNQAEFVADIIDAM